MTEQRKKPKQYGKEHRKDDDSRKRGRHYVTSGETARLSNGKESLVVFGRAADVPFGTVSHVDKNKMGSAIKEWYRAAKK
jgi:hypothetical protein